MSERKDQTQKDIINTKPQLAITGTEVVNSLRALNDMTTDNDQRAEQSLQKFIDQNSSGIPAHLLQRVDEEREKGTLTLADEINASQRILEQGTKEITELAKAKAAADREVAKAQHEKLTAIGFVVASLGAGFLCIAKAINTLRNNTK